MDFEFALSPDRRYGIARVLQDFDAAAAVERVQAILELAHTHSLRAFLIDVRSARFLGSAADHFGFANYELPKFEGTERIAIAVLAAPTDHSHDFLETVAQNAGFPVRVFKDPDAAREWLVQNVRAFDAGLPPAYRRL